MREVAMLLPRAAFMRFTFPVKPGNRLKPFDG